MAPTTWRNWAGNQTADGVTVIEPRGTEEIVAAVELAAREGKRVSRSATATRSPRSGGPRGSSSVSTGTTASSGWTPTPGS